MKAYVIFIVSIIFLSGCASSSLKVSDKNELLLQNNNKQIKVGSKVLTKDYEWYRNIDIYKSKIQNSKSVLLYEDVIADINWEFKHGTVATIQYIFDSYKSDVVYMSSDVALLQLRVNKTQFVNMLVEKSGTQELSYVYGFSNKEFIELAQKIMPKDGESLSKLKNEGIVFSSEIKHLSTWSVQMLFLEPLLKPVMRRGAGF